MIKFFAGFLSAKNLIIPEAVMFSKGLSVSKISILIIKIADRNKSFKVKNNFSGLLRLN